MIEQGARVYLKKDISVVGVPVGMKATVEHVVNNTYFFPVHLKLDAPCNDGHYYYRVNYEDIELLHEEEIQEPVSVVDADWFHVDTSEDIPI